MLLLIRAFTYKLDTLKAEMQCFHCIWNGNWMKAAPCGVKSKILGANPPCRSQLLPNRWVRGHSTASLVCVHLKLEATPLPSQAYQERSAGYCSWRTGNQSLKKPNTCLEPFFFLFLNSNNLDPTFLLFLFFRWDLYLWLFSCEVILGR